MLQLKGMWALITLICQRPKGLLSIRYRYDGLYTVEKAWMEKGLKTKFLVCKFALKVNRPTKILMDPTFNMIIVADPRSASSASERL